MTDSTDVVKRLTVEDIYNIKLSFLEKLNQFRKLHDEMDKELQTIRSYVPYRIEYRFDCFGKDQDEKYIDRCCWYYIIKYFELDKYMLCTDYDKLNKQIEKFDFPAFNIHNINTWIESLKDLIYDNVKTLVKIVYEKLITDYYLTGSSGYNNKTRKKRNNNGVDNNFILTTYDYNRIFDYRYKTTITDDLEKVCYILDNKKVPDINIISLMKSDKVSEYSNEYFKIKVCKNGNTHYTLNQEVVDKLNIYGANEGILINSNNIKIKIFENNF